MSGGGQMFGHQLLQQHLVYFTQAYFSFVQTLIYMTVRWSWLLHSWEMSFPPGVADIPLYLVQLVRSIDVLSHWSNSVISVSLGPCESGLKWHRGQFSHFCTAHGHDQHTD